ncbi:hypothetical protein BB559_004431 [Furculomyces boomerangus]|uniref:DUF1746 domain-containing protein n=1 Tax=Furculomyces boomerangus TaxID=61424 RepID=A0A2T9YER3_9FUNG|nr:hypothetical protein BB559_004431 [Furculomyces boomerangus]
MFQEALASFEAGEFDHRIPKILLKSFYNSIDSWIRITFVCIFFLDKNLLSLLTKLLFQESLKRYAQKVSGTIIFSIISVLFATVLLVHVLESPSNGIYLDFIGSDPIETWKILVLDFLTTLVQLIFALTMPSNLYPFLINPSNPFDRFYSSTPNPQQQEETQNDNTPTINTSNIQETRNIHSTDTNINQPTTFTNQNLNTQLNPNPNVFSETRIDSTETTSIANNTHFTTTNSNQNNIFDNEPSVSNNTNTLRTNRLFNNIIPNNTQNQPRSMFEYDRNSSSPNPQVHEINWSQILRRIKNKSTSQPPPTQNVQQ